MNLVKVFFILLLILSVSCGGGSGSSTSSTSNENNNSNSNNNEEPILTEKLIGTPFEGFTIGDSFTECTFIQNEFFTETVSENDLPIPVFVAFFTESEEEAIQEAIETANNAMKPTENDPNVGIEEDVLILIDSWIDEARVIIKVNDTFGEGATINTIGQARTYGYREIPGRSLSTTYTTDWEIRLSSSINLSDLSLVVAHELGHTLGISGHEFINYDNNTLSDLEINSLMGINGGSELNDYNYMMRNQAQNLRRNFGETTDGKIGSCVAEGEFGDTE
jgi:hypothetical protein